VGATAGGGNGAGGMAGVGGLGAMTWASSTTLPAAAGAGGALVPNPNGAPILMGGNAGLVILTYSSPDGTCSL